MSETNAGINFCPCCGFNMRAVYIAHKYTQGSAEPRVVTLPAKSEPKNRAWSTRRLSDEERAKILELRAHGKSRKQIAIEVNRSVSAVDDVIKPIKTQATTS